MRTIKRVARTAQTLFPAIRGVKFSSYNALTRLTGLHVEPEFKLLACLRPIGLAVDIGGNWGQSLEAIRYYGRSSAIVCFEPNTQLSKTLSERYYSDSAIQVEPVALGRENARFDLFVPTYNGFVFDGEASMHEDEATRFLNSRTMAFFNPEKVQVHAFTVAVRVLDDYNLTPDVVKIDVQGFELEVLQGGRTTFERSRPFTIIESPNAEVVQFFSNLGMTPYSLRGHELFKGIVFGRNSVFMTESQESAVAVSGRYRIVPSP